MRYEFILNPVAGNGYSVQAMKKIEGILNVLGAEYHIHETAYPGQATEFARSLSGDPDITAVIAVGGDGTVTEVAAGLAGGSTAMGIIPAGTGNDFIKSVRIPKDPETAMRFMLDRPARPVDTGTLNDEFFLNVCGTGFDVTVLECADDKKKKHRGLTPYFLGLLQAIRIFEPVDLQISYDGSHNADGQYLIWSVANGRFIGGGIPICPAADPRDGKLNLVMIRKLPRWKIPFYLPGLMLSRDLTFRITDHVLAESVTIRGKGLRFNIDGEIRRIDEAHFRIHPESLLLIC